MKLKYPSPPRTDFKETYHGIEIEDPYRYMEDPDHPETKQFVQENNKLVDEFIPQEKIAFYKNQLQDLYEYAKFSVPIKYGERYFYWRQEAGKSQPVYYYKDQFEEEQPILDVNNLSEDGTTAVLDYSVSHDGEIFLTSISKKGSDWQEVLIKKVSNGKNYERLQWVTFSEYVWRKDNSGFYYTKYPDQNAVDPSDLRKFARLYFHKLGTDQNEDILIFDPKNKNQTPFVSKYSNEKYIFISVSETTLPENLLFYRIEGDEKFTPIVNEFDGSEYEIVGLQGENIFVLTSFDAPNNRIIKISLSRPNRENWKELISEKEYLLDDAIQIGNRLVCLYQQNVSNKLLVYDLDGKFNHEVQLPSKGTIQSEDRFGSTFWGDENELFFGFTNFISPTIVYHYDFNTRSLKKYFTKKKQFDINDIEVQQVFYSSKDGTKIPMTIIHKKGLVRDANTPTILYGYGGYNVSLLPNFQPHYYYWVKSGGIYAIANLRGGGEFGKSWHQQALLGNKQNVFDDFIAAAEWLIEQKYTSTSKLAINGRSNGGLLVGACLTQRPDLFGAAIPQVGVLDMLRYPYQKDAGRYWTKEYGDAKTYKEHFDFLIKFSPVHNVKPQHYPPTLITSAEGDDRVVPMHSKKFAAELQYHQKGDAPVLLRVETKAGHGFGKPVTKMVEDQAYLFAFLDIIFELKS